MKFIITPFYSPSCLRFECVLTVDANTHKPIRKSSNDWAYDKISLFDFSIVTYRMSLESLGYKNLKLVLTYDFDCNKVIDCYISLSHHLFRKMQVYVEFN